MFVSFFLQNPRVRCGIIRNLPALRKILQLVWPCWLYKSVPVRQQLLCNRLSSLSEYTSVIVFTSIVLYCYCFYLLLHYFELFNYLINIIYRQDMGDSIDRLLTNLYGPGDEDQYVDVTVESVPVPLNQ